MPQIVAFAGPPGLAFSFSAFHLPARPLACVDGLVFSHPGSPLSRIRPQLPHTPPTGSVWGFAGVASLLDLQKRTQGHTGASLVFLLQNKFTPPPKGGGAGHRLSWVCWSFPAEKPGAFPQEKTDTSYPMTSLAVACGNCWSQPGHVGPTGRVCCFAGVVSLPGCQNRTRRHTGASLVSPPFPGALLLRKSRKLALQVIIHRLVNGKDRVKQRPVSRGSVPCPHGGRQRFDEILVL